MKTHFKAACLSRLLTKQLSLVVSLALSLNLAAASGSGLSKRVAHGTSAKFGKSGGQTLEPITSDFGNRSLSIMAGPSQSPSPTPPPLTIEPSQAARGGEPLEVTVTISAEQCKDTFKFPDENKVQADKDKLKGISLSDITVEDPGCKLTATLTIESDAPYGTQDLVFNLLNNKTATVQFRITKEEPLPPGPLPPGLRPQVDIMWGVVPQQIVKDNFGSRVGKLFYCIEVVIGNNTGYDLQIASVGFNLGPVGDAASDVKQTIHDAINDRAIKQTVSDAAAAEVKAITDESQADQDAAMAAIEKSLCEKARNTRRRDETCRKWQSARDKAMASRRTATESRRIALNTRDTADKALRNQVDAVKEEAAQMTRLSRVPYAQKIPVGSYMMTRGSLEHGQIWSPRNLIMNSLKAFGPFLTGFTPYFHVLNHRTNYSEGINIISNPLEKGFEAVVPDETINQLQRLDEQILRDGLIIPNNRQIRTRVFVSKELLNLRKDLNGKDMRDDPMMVNLALGEMYLIGNTVEYINRVSVTSGGSGEVMPPPTVNPTATQTFVQDQGPVTVTLTGTNLQHADITSDSPDTIKVSGTTSTSTSVSAQIQVTDQTSPGQHSLTVRTARPPAVIIPINVERPAPSISADDEAVSLSEGKPIKASLTENLEYKITVHGKYLQGATLKPLENNGKQLEITKQPDASQIDGTSFTATITVPKGTPAGTYEFEVRNDRAVNADKPAKINVVVVAQPMPAVDPNSQTILRDSTDKIPVANPVRSQDVTITITGKDLNGAKIIVPQNSNAVGKLEIVPSDKVNTSAAQLTATIKVKKEATPTNGQPVDYDLQVQNDNGDTAPFKFRLKPQPAPTITSPTEPVTAKAGQTIGVVISGTNLEGGQISLPTGWQIKSGPTPNSDGTQLTANISIAADAVPSGATDKAYTIEVTNSNTTVTPKPTFQVKVTP